MGRFKKQYHVHYKEGEYKVYVKGWIFWHRIGRGNWSLGDWFWTPFVTLEDAKKFIEEHKQASLKAFLDKLEWGLVHRDP